MKHSKTQSHAGLVLIAVLVWVSPIKLRADTTTPQNGGSKAKQESQTPPKDRTQKVPAHTTSHPSTHHPARRHVPSKARQAAAARRRRALMRPTPERIQEIQQALVQAAYLNEEPNGRWDDQTREAMRRYQADHGFPVTGLPEAKSLMKLGLGPHPLPVELDASIGGRAGPDTAKDGTPTPDAQQNPPTAAPQP